MAVLDQPVTAQAITYGIYDADEHYYEPEDAISRYLEPKYRHAVRWIELDGRRTLLINDRLLKVVPEPDLRPGRRAWLTRVVLPRQESGWQGATRPH